MIEIANEVNEGAAALISPDGGGPPLLARIGAVVLASTVRVPLIPVGASCRPSLYERHKWDVARNPLPYGRIAVVCGEPLTFPSFEDAASLEKARQQLQDTLDRTAEDARGVLGFKVPSFGPPTELNSYSTISRIFERVPRPMTSRRFLMLWFASSPSMARSRA